MSACHIRTADGARWAVEYDADGEPLRAQLRDWPYTIRPTGCEEQVIDGPTSRRLDHRFDELRCGRSVVCDEGGR